MASHTTNINTTESCSHCGRPNSEYVRMVASSSSPSFSVEWMCNEDSTRHVIFFDDGIEQGEKVFGSWDKAAEEYDRLVQELG